MIKTSLILISMTLLLLQPHDLEAGEHKAINTASDVSLDTTEFPNTPDKKLQSLMDETFEAGSYKKLIENKRLSLTVIDMTDEQHPALSHINGYETMYAASLPKIAILLAVFEEIDQGNLELTPEVQRSMEMMIKSSSNIEATRLYELVGADRIAEILQSERYQLYDEENGGGLWVGKPYGKMPAWKRDPLRNVSHGANGIQVARFYYLMEQNRLARPEFCPQMKEILSGSTINHKFVKGLSSYRPDAEIYRKSGTWRDYHSDSALVERSDGTKYIIVAIAQDNAGSQLLEQVIVDVDKIIDRYQASS